MRKYLLIFALLIGVGIAYVDSQPTWDDTGITAGAIFLTAGLLALISVRRPWLWALAVGIWTPLWTIICDQNYGAVIALFVAFIGAYLGMAVRRGWDAMSNWDSAKPM
jgi:hypothetical protein